MNDQEKEKILKYEFFVAGVKYHELHLCIGELEIGDVLSLVTEPTNEYDPNAVKIEYQSPALGKGVMIGYVPATISAAVTAALVYSELKCEIVELNKSEKPWKQVRVAITKIEEEKEDEVS